jgi:hypothetical protein
MPFAADSLRVTLAKYRSIRSALSKTSAKLSIGSCLEDSFAIPLDIRSETKPLDRFRQQIHRTAD